MAEELQYVQQKGVQMDADYAPDAIPEEATGEVSYAGEEVAAGDRSLFQQMFPDTPELEVPVPDPQAHRGTIEGVSRRDADTGTVGIQVDLKSIDTGLTDNLTIWLPKVFSDDIHVNPLDISDVPAPGKKQSPKERYGQVVHNKKNNAELDKLLAIAAEADRVPAGVPADLDEYVAMLNELLTGVQVVFVRRVERNSDPQFADKLKVQRIESITTADNDKFYRKGFRKMWLEQ